MTDAVEAPKIAILCAHCGSSDVSRDAFADWDFASQNWVLRSVYDYAHCHRCDGEARLIEVPVGP